MNQSNCCKKYISSQVTIKPNDYKIYYVLLEQLMIVQDEQKRTNCKSTVFEYMAFA